MSTKRIVGLAGSFSQPSKTFTLVKYVADALEFNHDVDAALYDLNDLGPSLGAARWRRDLDHQAETVLNDVVAADLLVVGAPTYKGSYPGLFKHLIDLIDPLELRSKPVILLATGGGDRHALVVEHQLRPLFGFFAAHTLPTAIYASDEDFENFAINPKRLGPRFDALAADVAGLLPPKRGASVVTLER